MDHILLEDPELARAFLLESDRQMSKLELIASENFVSSAVREAQGSVFTHKYAEGYPGKRYYGGCEFVDIAENLAIERAKQLFGCDYVNVQPHSGSQANMASYFALAKPGDTILGMNLSHGGHLTHGSAVNFSGKLFDMKFYDVDDQGFIDFADVERKAAEYKPKLILAGASAYSRVIDFARFAEIAKSVGAYFMVDMAHIAGLVAAGVHPSPVPYADVVTTTTHKTLRGPRGGMILSRDEEFAKKLNSAVFPGTQGGPLMHVIAGKAVCLREAAQPEFKVYAENVVKNAKALADALLARGFDLVTGGTDNHLMLADLRKKNITGKDLQTKLDEVHITVNKNAIPNDPQKPGVTSGVRIGTPACTTRGFTPEDMPVVADCIDKIATDFESNRKAVLAAVAELVRKHPIYE